MADPGLSTAGAPALRDAFGPEVVDRIARMVGAADPAFPAAAFTADALDGFQDLGLTARARAIAGALWAALPGGFERAAAVLEASLGPEIEADTIDGQGMATFVYLPHVFLVAEHGLDHFETAMHLQHALTRRFTAEFSIRPFIEREPERTLARLAEWTGDPSAHVRRLVSEGTRPRLPWAPRLRSIQADPSPVLPLLEALRDDPSAYVRRSVANNLNDISKDHPEVVVAVCRRWSAGAGPERRALVRHALRTLSRAGDPGALDVLGVADAGGLTVTDLALDPPEPRIGGSVRATCRITPDAGGRDVLVHLRVHFVNARGTGVRTFLMGEGPVPAGGRTFRKSVSLRQHTTRTHRPGMHRVEVLVNGVPMAEGAFELHA